ncbi:MAG: Stp1/IreP family PP2C-type Ser/Thr phosphatase [Armatimonadetes bacterium]|nr:Stp1/IreP family PP2C-type Ser/Thr phosphatase [Armatimonadota bacterium]
MEEITAEFATEDLVPRVDLRVKPCLTVAARTDLGRVRENNEDKHDFFIPSTDDEIAARGMIFIVCDGMGGHEAGQIASEMACKTFIEVYRNHPSEDPSEAALSAVHAANRYVLDVARAVPSRKGMGCTLSALMIVQDRAIIAQVGDSRVYRLRDGELSQITTDHTWVEETVASEMMSREEAEKSPYRHVLTRAIGTEQDVKADVFDEIVEPGDVYLLCSDGLTNHVCNETIAEQLLKGPSEAVWDLVDLALADGGSDNTTAVVVRVDALEEAN